MSKSLYKVPYIGREMLIKSFRSKKKNVFFYDRNTLVPFCFVNDSFDIYQGCEFKNYTYRKKQLGMKLGEFAPTHSRAQHKGKRVKVSKKRERQKKSFTYDLKSDFFTR